MRAFADRTRSTVYQSTGATFSPCRTWRYSLSREWDDSCPRLNVIGLNPSTADEQRDDPTIRRCVDFARRWGYGAVVVTNVFAYRATAPSQMKSFPDAVGPDNDTALRSHARTADLVLAAWGLHGTYRSRSVAVMALLQGMDVYCLRSTKHGHPAHPLYVPGSTTPVLYQPVR